MTKLIFLRKSNKNDFCNPRSFHPDAENIVGGTDKQAIDKLSKSIKERGLTNPLIVVREVNEEGEERFKSLGGMFRDD